MSPFAIQVDTREQSPWQFTGIVMEKRLWVIQREITTLATGDYTIGGMADRFTIERKSASDLVGSISTGNARFRREHERMADLIHFGGESGGFACVIIEGSLSEICDELDRDEGRRVTSSMVLGVTASWPMRYGVPWFFAGDRRWAELLAFRVMLKWWKEHG